MALMQNVLAIALLDSFRSAQPNVLSTAFVPLLKPPGKLNKDGKWTHLCSLYCATQSTSTYTCKWSDNVLKLSEKAGKINKNKNKNGGKNENAWELLI